MSLSYYLTHFHTASVLVHFSCPYFKYGPSKKLDREAKESGRGARDADPHPICSPGAAPSISFVPPPATGVSCLFGSKPSKPVATLKPEQHGGELNHSPARWEFLAGAEQEKDQLLDDAKSRERLCLLSVQQPVMTLCPSNDRAYRNYNTFFPTQTEQWSSRGATVQLFLLVCEEHA